MTNTGTTERSPTKPRYVATHGPREASEMEDTWDT